MKDTLKYLPLIIIGLILFYMILNRVLPARPKRPIQLFALPPNLFLPQ